MSPALALVLGLAYAQLFPQPWPEWSSRATQSLLKASVVLLGFGMQALEALRSGEQGLWVSLLSISGVLLAGLALGHWLKIGPKASLLISAGTAICGGSAIAALAPLVRARKKQLSVAMGTVFALNSVALLVFPLIGHALALSQRQFGLWCALAIHDTSSVVGAASVYGAKALQIATTVKLVRALWIIPLSLALALSQGRSRSRVQRKQRTRIQVPYFLGLFVLAMFVGSFVPGMRPLNPRLVGLGEAGLRLSLFFIGSSLPLAHLRTVGLRPLVQGLLLWILVASVSLELIYHLA